ncbi:hypothetical protein LguiB_016909 [Lonicera macranthoides]
MEVKRLFELRVKKMVKEQYMDGETDNIPSESMAEELSYGNFNIEANVFYLNKGSKERSPCLNSLRLHTVAKVVVLTSRC